MTIEKLEKGKEVLDILNKNGGSARFVGGCVRNHLLGVALSDIDIATTLTPAQATAAFESKGIRVIPTGVDFGTITAVYGKKNYEITTLRSDLSCDGRHAKVSFSKDYAEDAARRDFTFNALYMDIDGKIYDFFDGQKDLKNGVVKFIGSPEERIREDYLRILRLFRFHAYFGAGNISQDQLDACRSLCNGLDQISGERIHAEMIKLLSSSKCFNAIDAMISCGVLSQITALSEGHFRPEFLIKISGMYNELGQAQNPIVALHGLLDKNMGEDKMEALFDRWRLSNKEKALFERLNEALQIDLTDDYNLRKTARINGKDEFIQYVILNYAKGQTDLQTVRKLIIWVAGFVVPEFPLKSEDLLKLGLTPGKQFGQILRAAEELWERKNYKLGKKELLEQLNITVKA